MDERELIDNIISTLDFIPKHHKIIKKDNKIFIKCHTYFINIFNNNEEDVKIKTIEYIQPSLFINNNYNNIINNINNKELYICVNYADIIIDLDNNSYNIIKSNFNIRKPTFDKFNLFQKIIDNLNTNYFIINYDTMFINYYYSNFNSNIYHITNIDIIFINDNNDKIIIDLLMKTTSIISPDIYIKPLINNQFKIIIIKKDLRRLIRNL